MLPSVENYFGDYDENIKRVLAAYGKTSADLTQDIEIIKSWQRTQHHLPEISSDRLIISMLLKSKFSIEKCKNSLDMYYSLRTLIPEMYENRNPKLPNMQYVLNKNYSFPLPTLTEDGYRVFFNKIGYDPEKAEAYDVLAQRFIIGEIRFLEDVSLGDVYIEDLANVRLAHVVKYTPTVLKKGTTLFEKAYNVRMKAWHFINAPPYFDTVFSVIKQLLSPKLAQRMHIHKSIDDVKKHIDPKILPIEYGGSDYSMDELLDSWNKKFVQYQDHFDKLEKLKTDESKRPSPLNNDELLGYYGNFKKLNVD